MLQLYNKLTLTLQQLDALETQRLADTTPGIVVTVVGTKRTVISSSSGSRHLIGQLVAFEASDWSIGGVRGI